MNTPRTRSSQSSHYIVFEDNIIKKATTLKTPARLAIQRPGRSLLCESAAAGSCVVCAGGIN